MFVHGYINGCAYFPFFKTTYKKTEGWAKTFAYCSPCSTCRDWSGLDLERWRFWLNVLIFFSSGVIVLAFVLCWLPFHVGRTIFSLSLGTGTERQETYLDTNSQSDTITHVSMDRKDVTIPTVTNPPSHLDLDINTETLSLHSRIMSHTKGRHEKTDIHNGHTQNKNVSAHVINTQPDNRNTHNQLQRSTNTITHSLQSKLSITIKSQHDKPETAPPIPTTAYSAASTELHYDHTYNDTVFSDTYAPPDTHLYFLYYLSQYFNLVSSVLFYLSAAVNPLLYNLMSARYRHAVRSLIRTQSHAQARRMHTLTVHHSTTTLWWQKTNGCTHCKQKRGNNQTNLNFFSLQCGTVPQIENVDIY